MPIIHPCWSELWTRFSARTGAPCRDFPAHAVGVRARAEVSDGCHLCPAPVQGGVGTGGAAAGVIYRAAVSARRAGVGSGPAAAAGRGARPGGGRAAVAP